MKTKRVLAAGEFSLLNTGYANYAFELLSRLGRRYEVVEYASYCPPKEQWGRDLPWRVVPVPPHGDNKEGFDANSTDQFGGWQWERVVNAVRPDVVLGIRDPWMDEFLMTSPLRPYYGLVYMPTVDGVHQKDDWLAQYQMTDALLSYTDWGAGVLRDQSAHSLNVLGSAPAGVDGDVFRPVGDRRKLREEMGLDPDAIILGMVARNQRRKLFPDLFGAFKKLLSALPEEAAKRTYLYAHTAWPDVGWDVPRLLRDHEVGSRVLFTYACRNCKKFFPSFFQDSCGHCRHCGAYACGFPNTKDGLTRQQLATVYNLFDVYVQYASREGFGLPMVEAAACGLPVLGVDYSSVSDVVRKVGGELVEVAHLSTESETGMFNAVPSSDGFVRKARELLVLPTSVRQGIGRKAREMCLGAYSWDRTAAVWARAIDSVGPKRGWDAPPRLHSPPISSPGNLTNAEWARWGIFHLAGLPEMAGTYFEARLVRDLGWGMTTGAGMGGHYMNDECVLGNQPRMKPFGRAEAEKMLRTMGEKKNAWEKARVGQ